MNNHSDNLTTLSVFATVQPVSVAMLRCQSQAAIVSTRLLVGSINGDKYDHLSDHQLLKRGGKRGVALLVSAINTNILRHTLFENWTKLCVHCVLPPRGTRIFSAGRVCAGYWPGHMPLIPR